MEDKKIKLEVKRKYSEIAKKASSCGCECGDNSIPLVDYGELSKETVKESDLGLGCGIPTRYANFKPGEVVLDLGSGAGIDVFLAAKEVGPGGRVIGLDMTPEMIEKAQKNAKDNGYDNVEFRLGEIESLPVEDDTIDKLISNCVINLVPDKQKAYAEILRVLKKGGSFSISDVVAYGKIPDKILKDVAQWTGCIAGAMDKDEYLKLIKDLGFKNVQVKEEVNLYQNEKEKYGFASITVEGNK